MNYTLNELENELEDELENELMKCLNVYNITHSKMQKRENIQKIHNLFINNIPFDIDYSDDEQINYCGLYNRINKKYDESVKLYKISTKRGNHESMNNLAFMYWEGHGVWQNYEKAIKLWKMAIEKGSVCAMNSLAAIYSTNGLYENYDEAVKLYKIAIKKGHMRAMNDLAHMYDCGYGVEKNHKKLKNYIKWQLTKIVSFQWAISH